MTRAIVARRRRAEQEALTDGQRARIIEATAKRDEQIARYRAEKNKEVADAEHAFYRKRAAAFESFEQRRRDIIAGAE